MEFVNVYEDSRRAESYAKLGLPGTYYLAYRDLPKIISSTVKGNRALDFGCGTGRSTRFLQKLGFKTSGVDISRDMIIKARQLDPEGEYYLVDDGDLSLWKDQTFDLILSAFTFDNIPTIDKKVILFREMNRIITKEGKVLSLVSSPDIYQNEWASFTTREFPENKQAKSGDKVKIIMTDVEDQRPVEDILCTDEEYHKVFQKAGLEVVRIYRPLGNIQEPFPWVSETRISPWVIYVLNKHSFIE